MLKVISGLYMNSLNHWATELFSAESDTKMVSETGTAIPKVSDAPSPPPSQCIGMDVVALNDW